MKDRRAVASWCFYDWANSAFPTVIGTFIFGTYFTKAIAETPEIGAAQWGLALGVAGVVVAVFSPFFGAIADQQGRRKPWLGGFTAMCVIATALLWYATPESSSVLWALIFVAVASAAFEFTMVFYNAMLPEIAPKSHVGRLSGLGWGLGYVGGLAALALCLVGFVETDTPWFGLSTDAAENIRAIVLLVAAWYAVFSVPLFLFTPDRPSTGLSNTAAVRAGIGELVNTIRQIRHYHNILWFLVARMLYTDGLGTLFAFGGIYAAGTFGMDLGQVITFGIALNVTAGLGAAGFAWLDDKVGAKPVIIVSLVAMIGLGTALLVVESLNWFWGLGILLGIFVGPAQSASRSLMARLAPEAIRTEMFGLYAFSGKATGFLGPIVLAAVTTAFDSQRVGMGVIIVFFIVGLLLLLRVRET
ncbi:MAG: MFS transporter [Pseudomonadota bacterium]|nr:MFS transporter [Pseudomonadota bacterium]